MMQSTVTSPSALDQIVASADALRQNPRQARPLRALQRLCRIEMLRAPSDTERHFFFFVLLAIEHLLFNVVGDVPYKDDSCLAPYERFMVSFSNFLKNSVETIKGGKSLEMQSLESLSAAYVQMLSALRPLIDSAHCTS